MSVSILSPRICLLPTVGQVAHPAVVTQHHPSGGYEIIQCILAVAEMLESLVDHLSFK